MKKEKKLPGCNKWCACSALFVTTIEGESEFKKSEDDICKGYPLIKDFGQAWVRSSEQALYLDHAVSECDEATGPETIRSVR